MTMPHERLRALVWAGEMLYEIARERDKHRERFGGELPKELMREALMVLRHYPSKGNLEHFARCYPVEQWIGLSSEQLAEEAEEKARRAAARGTSADKPTISKLSYQAALAKGIEAMARPHVTSATYARAAHMLELVYSTGFTLRIDPRRFDLLRDIPETSLANAYVTPGGDGLIFDATDRAIDLVGLVASLVPLEIAQRVIHNGAGQKAD
ncbi:DUF2442 domain-containing protein [Variovorax sp. J22R133]|uniref:DUF2442 domain-containing protein n=1 Tax=Variovorax brevis TaxID=3053503 RepID=UPI0025780FAF|nr:DUF2442 domain-containing protein [Variovorax sp. J22R133]MDM0116226.1 DUF2442 domain-containing protein [Variovorax sp. J22R133]